MRNRVSFAAAALLGMVACGPSNNVPGLEVYLDPGDGKDHGPLTTIQLSSAGAGLMIEETFNEVLTVQGTFEDGTNIDLNAVPEVTWSIDDTTIATLSDKTPQGVTVTAVSAGAATVTVTIGTLTITESLTVMPPALIGLEVASSGPIAFSEVGNVTATATYRDNSTADVTTMVTWSSSAPDVIAALDDVGRKGLIYAAGRGDATITAVFEDQTATIDLSVACALAPSMSIGSGAPMATASWPGAISYDLAGNMTTAPLSINELMCDPAYDDVRGFVFSLNAGWCGPCHAWMRTAAAAEQQLADAGVMPVYVVGDTAARGTFSASNTAYADQLSTAHAGDSRSIRLGDADTQGAGPDGIKQVLNTTQGWPSLFVVRRADMQVLSLSAGAPRTVDGIIQTINDNPVPGGGGPMTMTNCMDGQEEATEPNDTIQLAPQLGTGTIEGGICTPAPDFFRVNVDGPWRATLTFQNSTADLDLYAWDETQDRILSRDGMPVGSFGNRRDFESIDMMGPGLIRIQAKADGATAPYTLSIEPL